MPAAVIKINGVVGSNDDLPINVLVLLDNQNAGGEITYLWSIVDQPLGAADALSATNIQNPTFTPKKEGTYLLKLVVNQALVSEVTDTKIVGIRQVKKPALRIPAAGETLEDGTTGWAPAVDAFLRTIDSVQADPGVLVGVNGGGTALAAGVVYCVRPIGITSIKLGLPGEETFVPTFAIALATLAQQFLEGPLYAAEGGVDGAPAGAGILMRVRRFGRIAFPITALAGSVLGDPVFLQDDGTIKPGVVGTTSRRVGTVTRVITPTTYAVDFDGSTLPTRSQMGPLKFSGSFPTADTNIGGDTFLAGNLEVGLTLDVAGAATFDAGLAVVVGDATFIQGATRQNVTKSGGGLLGLETATADPVNIGTNSVDRWQVKATGELASVGGNRQIQNVLDPIVAQDAATKNYVDTVSSKLRQTLTTEITVDTTTASAVFVAFLSQVITIAAGSKVMIWFSFGGSNSTNNNGLAFRIQIDGVTKRGTAASTISPAGATESGGIVQEISGLAVGVRTVTVQWRATSGGTAQVRPVTVPDFEHATLVIAEVTA